MPAKWRRRSAAIRRLHGFDDSFVELPSFGLIFLFSCSFVLWLVCYGGLFHSDERSSFHSYDRSGIGSLAFFLSSGRGLFTREGEGRSRFHHSPLLRPSATRNRPWPTATTAWLSRWRPLLLQSRARSLLGAALLSAPQCLLQEYSFHLLGKTPAYPQRFCWQTRTLPWLFHAGEPVVRASVDQTNTDNTWTVRWATHLRRMTRERELPPPAARAAAR